MLWVQHVAGGHPSCRRPGRERNHRQIEQPCGEPLSVKHDIRLMTGRHRIGPPQVTRPVDRELPDAMCLGGERYGENHPYLRSTRIIRDPDIKQAPPQASACIHGRFGPSRRHAHGTHTSTQAISNRTEPAPSGLAPASSRRRLQQASSSTACSHVRTARNSCTPSRS